MEQLHWPLTVLSKAVHFKNLTTASAHVGLSQPQLSRLISKIEKEYDIVLLDRTAKRKSGWTPAAHMLAETYILSSKKLKDSLAQILAEQLPSHITIGTLEGLSSVALKATHFLLVQSKVAEVEIDIYDQNDLEVKFLNGDIDLIFTSRNPNKQKYTKHVVLGYQSLDTIDKNKEFSVLSPYEYGVKKKKPTNKILISNSLNLRKQWLETYGGEGIIPSDIKKNAFRDMLPVSIIGHPTLNETIWRTLLDSVKTLHSF